MNSLVLIFKGNKNMRTNKLGKIHLNLIMLMPSKIILLVICPRIEK